VETVEEAHPEDFDSYMKTEGKKFGKRDRLGEIDSDCNGHRESEEGSRSFLGLPGRSSSRISATKSGDLESGEIRNSTTSKRDGDIDGGTCTPKSDRIRALSSTHDLVIKATRKIRKSAMEIWSDPKQLKKKMDLSRLLLPGLLEPAPLRKNSAVSTPVMSQRRSKSSSSPWPPSSPVGSIDLEQQGEEGEDVFQFPTHEELVDHFAHPSTTSRPIHVWIPDVSSATSGVFVESEDGSEMDIMERVKADVLAARDGGGVDGFASHGIVVTSVGSFVDGKGKLKVKASAVMRVEPE
jgi:hypothetical protein